MRCQSCNKFVALNFEDPEVVAIDLNGSEVTAEVRIVRTSECCGEEMKEAGLEMSAELPEEFTKEHEGEGHELSVEEDGVDQIEEGGGRYKKAYFGATVNFKVTCECGAEHAGTMSDKVAASGMDEMQ